MKKLFTFLKVVTLILIIMLLTSCTHRLNAVFYATTNPENGTAQIDFYGPNLFQYIFAELHYDPAIDIYYPIPGVRGTYKIYESKDNPDQLLIEFFQKNKSLGVYTYEQTVCEDGSIIIILDGKEFKATHEHPSNYFILELLYEIRIIDTAPTP